MRVLEQAADLPETGPLRDALAARERLMVLTQASHDAALTPRDPGGISRVERAAFAARMARHCRSDALAAHYDALCGTAPEADFARPGGMSADPRQAAMLAYVDKMTLHPRDAEPGDIDVLRAAGLVEGDIVRLAGLVAFVNYQIRTAHALRLMAEGA
jgi:uncharacterized protein YciW